MSGTKRQAIGSVSGCGDLARCIAAPTTVSDQQHRETNSDDLLGRAGPRRATWMFLAGLLVSGFLLSGFRLGYERGSYWGQQSTVALIAIRGSMSSGGGASAEMIIPALVKACDSESVRFVALQMDSNGGTPFEAERVVAALRRCQQEQSKKVYALIESTCVSACYMVAMQADKIVAGRYSVVGSVGVVIRHLDASELAMRMGVAEKLYRSGSLKGGPSHLSPTSD